MLDHAELGEIGRLPPEHVVDPRAGELEQIQFLLGHLSIQTTERYLGRKQKLRCAVSDRLGIEPNAPA
jgi:hypothetical protein